MKTKYLLVALGAAMASPLIAAGESCITKVGETEVSTPEEVAGRLEIVATANAASAASASATLEGGVSVAGPSANAPLEGGIAVWDESGITDCDFTPAGAVYIIR